MIKQIVNGKNVRTVNVTGSEADMTILKELMDGELQEWDSKATGGTPANPAVLNHIGFAVGKVLIGGRRQSQSVFVPHVKATKHFSDIRTAVVGSWDASYLTSTACAYANPYNMKSEV